MDKKLIEFTKWLDDTDKIFSNQGKIHNANVMVKLHSIYPELSFPIAGIKGHKIKESDKCENCKVGKRLVV